MRAGNTVADDRFHPPVDSFCREGGDRLSRARPLFFSSERAVASSTTRPNRLLAR